MTSKPTLLLEHYLKQLKLPTFHREYAPMAAWCSKEKNDYPTCLLKLSEREVIDREKRAAYERQDHKCANGTRCRTPGNDDGQHVFEIDEMEGDHITPWSKGGKTIAENCQMLCLPCNRDKSGL